MWAPRFIRGRRLGSRRDRTEHGVGVGSQLVEVGAKLVEGGCSHHGLKVPHGLGAGGRMTGTMAETGAL